MDTDEKFYLIVGAGLICAIGYLAFKYLFMYEFTLHDIWLVPAIVFGWPGIIIFLGAMKAYCQAKKWEDAARQRAKLVDFQKAREARDEGKA